MSGILAAPSLSIEGGVYFEGGVFISGGFWLCTSGGARAPRSDSGGPPGRSLDSTSYPLGRARSSWASPWPSRFLRPREPLSWPGWGSWIVRRCFQALLSAVGLRLPVFPRVPFLACDLACLAYTVQIKVVSVFCKELAVCDL